MALLTSWLFANPKEKKSTTIGWVWVSLEMLPTDAELSDESKLITKNAFPDFELNESMSLSSIWTRPCAEKISPLSIIVIGDGSESPKYKDMFVSEKSFTSSCCWKDLKS